jgi:hypothetical protein
MQTAAWAYTYDNAGNRTSGKVNGIVHTYTYNDGNQINRSEPGNTTNPFSHNGNGNETFADLDGPDRTTGEQQKG